MKKKILVEFTNEMLIAIDTARGEVPRNPWLESQLRKLKAIRDGADAAGVELPSRPLEGRGGKREA